MRVKITVSESQKHAAGHALVKIAGVGDISQDHIKTLIKQTDKDNPVLGPNGWQPSNHFHELPIVDRLDGQVSVIMTPEQTAQIAPNTGIIFEFTEPFLATGQIGWPAITQQTGRVSGRYRRRAAAENNATIVSAPIQDAVADASVEQASAPDLEGAQPQAEAPSPKTATTSGALPKSIIFGAIGAVLFAVGGYFSFSSDLFDSAEPAKLAYWSGEQVRKYLQNQPATETSLEQAHKLIKAGKPDLAFLLLKQAAKSGAAEAQRMLGEMYDPKLFSAATSPLPSANGEIAARHYQSASDQGDAVAQRHLGVLMIEGLHGREPDVEGGRALLARAVASGDDKAKKYLDKLK